MSKRSLDRDSVLPLTTAEFHILLALQAKPLPGSGGMHQADFDSEHVVHIGSGTLYPALDRLECAGWIAKTSTHYSITTTGQLVLEWEAKRLRGIVNLAESRLGAKNPVDSDPSRLLG